MKWLIFSITFYATHLNLPAIHWLINTALTAYLIRFYDRVILVVGPFRISENEEKSSLAVVNVSALLFRRSLFVLTRVVSPTGIITKFPHFNLSPNRQMLLLKRNIRHRLMPKSKFDTFRSFPTLILSH